ncbi:helix-turn-helix domain-containing protein [Virgibacillus tibetensis]|uniref:helix-turn-helix domain-containing protein n=1 Tax=Virgibacillus tibetensis TaxID=3042313 RepID=UPI00389AB5EF
MGISFCNIAEELNVLRSRVISQATLSHQIKMLEQEIGYPLFNRVGKKIELTKVGEFVHC